MAGSFRCRRRVTERAVRAHRDEVPAVVLEQNLKLGECVEDLPVEQLIPLSLGNLRPDPLVDRQIRHGLAQLGVSPLQFLHPLRLLHQEATALLPSSAIHHVPSNQNLQKRFFELLEPIYQEIRKLLART